MEHIFVLNPAAGKGDIKSLQQRIQAAADRRGVACCFYITQGPGDGERFVRRRAGRGDPVRFYACGGDGTLYELLNGCYGFPNAQLAVVPMGSGNDFIRSFTGGEAFLDLDAQLAGEPVLLDVIGWNRRYAMNLCNIGWDCDICRRTNRLKTLPLMNGEEAYLLAVGVSMFCRFGKQLRLTFPDGETYEDRMVLTAIGNGSWYGGGFCAAPRAVLNDGWLEVSAVSGVNRLQIASLIQHYKAGRHLDLPAFQPFLHYRRARQVTIESPSPFEVCADGEISQVERVTFTAQAPIPFLLPRGAGLAREEKPPSFSQQESSFQSFAAAAVK